MTGPGLLAPTLVGLFVFAWLGYFRWKDALHPEPVLLMLAVAAGGAGAAVLALATFAGLEALGLPTAWEQLASPAWGEALGAALRVGLVEEGAKLLPVLPVALRLRCYDEPLDGIVYAACAGLGFAAAESAVLLWTGELGPIDSLARAAAAPLTHALMAAPAGLGLAAAVLHARRWALPLGLGASVGVHALYDLLLARPELPPAGAALLVLALWGWLLWVAPRLARLGTVARH
jgi:protease PrsW